MEARLEAKSAASRPRILVLDLARALAITLVLVHHTPLAWLDALPIPSGLGHAIRRGGWVGVDLFFVLSGFLVTGLLLREHARYGELRLSRFYVRRSLKILPMFHVFLLFGVLLTLYRTGALPPGLLAEVLFIQNYVPGIWGHTWSLAVEEHFYLLMPLCLLLLTKFAARSGAPFRRLPWLCGVLLAVFLGGRFVIDALFEFSGRLHFYPTHVRMDGLWFGVLLAYLHHTRQAAFVSLGRRYFPAIVSVGVLLLLPVFFLEIGATRYLHTLGFTQFYLGCALLLWGLLARGVPDNRWTRWTSIIGTHSYAIYLWHPVVRDELPGLVGRVLGQDAWVGLPALGLYVAGSVGMGILMTQVIERPMLRLRDRWWPSRSAVLRAAGASDGMPSAPS